jgi:hypothetical protein
LLKGERHRSPTFSFGKVVEPLSDELSHCLVMRRFRGVVALSGLNVKLFRVSLQCFAGREGPEKVWWEFGKRKAGFTQRRKEETKARKGLNATRP